MIARPALWLLLTGLLPAVGSAWVEPVRDCLQARSAEVDSALPFAELCPAASQALHEDAWAALTVEPEGGWSLGAVRALDRLVAHYRHAGSGPAIAGETLDGILASLPEQAAPAGPSAWERLLAWLLERTDQEDLTLPAWLRELSVSDRVATAIWYVTLTVIVLLALAIVINELRFRQRRRPLSDGSTAAAPSGPGALEGAALPALAELTGRPPREQMELLLRMLTQGLQRRGLLPARPGLTHREIAREIAETARLEVAHRQLVGALSGAAERATFGGWTPAAADVAPYLHAARPLLNVLNDRADA